MVAALAALPACSLIAAPDRDKIPGPDAGAGFGGSIATGGSAGSAIGGSSGSAGRATGGTGGTGGHGGSSGSAGSAGTAGAGGAGTACSTAADCTATSECWTATCKNSVCGEDLKQDGTALATQTAGDCKKQVCNGSGSVVSVNDPADIEDDKNPCTTDSCNNGSPVHTPVAVNTVCGTNLKCDSSGNCVGCIAPSDCPGQDNECQSRTCVGGVCGVNLVQAGTPLSVQTPGDCAVDQCDGTGKVEHVAANDPLDDGNQCTRDLCVGTTPSNPPESAGTACTIGGKVCDGNGKCVACVVDGDCGTNNACTTYHCSASGTCSVDNTPAGTPIATQTAGDCKVVVCTSSGTTQTNNDNTDFPNDNKQCTDNVCTAGVPSNPPLNAGTACTESGGVVCDGSGNCVACIDGTTCTSKVCDTTAHTCKAATCSDGVQNGSETDVDCGGGTCTKTCATGEKCVAPADCTSGICTANTCADPAVVSTSPAGAATNVGVSTAIAITFNAAMDPATLGGKVTLDSGPCNGTIQLSSDNFTTCLPFSAALATMSTGNTVATLTPAPTMSYGSSYKIRVTTAAQTQSGALPLAATYTSTAFTTVLPASGTQNESGATDEADFCNVVTTAFSVKTGQPTPTITGAIRELGKTDSPGGSSLVTAEVGYGPRDKNPESEAGWIFSAATYSVDNATDNTDEYTATFTAPAAGTYGFVYRFSLDGGTSWTYCDLNGAGSETGFAFETTQIPVMTVTP